MEGIRVRHMTSADIPLVHDMAQQCFTTPWQTESFEYEISNRDAVLQVAEIDNKPAGYVCIRTILDVTHIMDIAVSPELRRAGIGTRLLQSALQQVRSMQRDLKIITLEVRESNIAAVRLYEKFGFKEIGRRKDYYKKPTEDALIMELDTTKPLHPRTFH